MKKCSHGIIYVMVCIPTNKMYVGQTTASVKTRIAGHKGSPYPLGRAIRKYGIEQFKIYEYKGIPIELLDYAEIELIKKLDTRVRHGYNIMGGGQENRIMSEESRRKLSLALMGRSVWNKGKPMSPESREKDRQNNLGRKHTEETKRKMSISAKRVIHTPEWNMNVSLAQRGKYVSEETREKIRSANKGRKHSEEYKRRHKEIMKEWWAKRKSSGG